MTIAQVSALMMRLFGAYLFLNLILVITELPTEVYGIIATHFDYIRSEREVVLAATLIRLVVYAIGGTCFIAFSRSLGKLFAKGLEGFF